MQLGLGIALALAVAVALVRLDGERRVVLAGLVGAAAAVASLGSLGVFRHGVIVSVLPGCGEPQPFARSQLPPGSRRRGGVHRP